MAKKVTKWECDNCGDIHDDEKQANDCCKSGKTMGDPVVELHC